MGENRNARETSKINSVGKLPRMTILTQTLPNEIERGACYVFMKFTSTNKPFNLYLLSAYYVLVSENKS